MRNFVFLLSLLGTPMTVGINTEAINHKNIPFTMYDLGWVVLCIGAAIGSGIVFFPLQVGLKGVWVFALAVILGYPVILKEIYKEVRELRCRILKTQISYKILNHLQLENY